MDYSAQFDLLLQILGATVLAGIVGLEREFADKPAGLRPHMLTGAVAALLVILGEAIISSFNPPQLVASDPIRIIQAIIVGISFLGAGTIFKNRGGDSDYIEGLTTGASLLSVSAIGIAVALNLWALAIGVTLINVLVNWGVDGLAHRLKLKKSR